MDWQVLAIAILGSAVIAGVIDKIITTRQRRSDRKHTDADTDKTVIEIWRRFRDEMVKEMEQYKIATNDEIKLLGKMLDAEIKKTDDCIEELKYYKKNA